MKKFILALSAVILGCLGVSAATFVDLSFSPASGSTVPSPKNGEAIDISFAIPGYESSTEIKNYTKIAITFDGKTIERNNALGDYQWRNYNMVNYYGYSPISVKLPDGAVGTLSITIGEGAIYDAYDNGTYQNKAVNYTLTVGEAGGEEPEIEVSEVIGGVCFNGPKDSKYSTFGSYPTIPIPYPAKTDTPVSMGNDYVSVNTNVACYNYSAFVTHTYSAATGSNYFIITPANGYAVTGVKMWEYYANGDAKNYVTNVGSVSHSTSNSYIQEWEGIATTSNPLKIEVTASKYIYFYEVEYAKIIEKAPEVEAGDLAFNLKEGTTLDHPYATCEPIVITPTIAGAEATNVDLYTAMNAGCGTVTINDNELGFGKDNENKFGYYEMAYDIYDPDNYFASAPSYKVYLNKKQSGELKLVTSANVFTSDGANAMADYTATYAPSATLTLTVKAAPVVYSVVADVEADTVWPALKDGSKAVNFTVYNDDDELAENAVRTSKAATVTFNGNALTNFTATDFGFTFTDAAFNSDGGQLAISLPKGYYTVNGVETEALTLPVITIEAGEKYFVTMTEEVATVPAKTDAVVSFKVVDQNSADAEAVLNEGVAPVVKFNDNDVNFTFADNTLTVSAKEFASAAGTLTVTFPQGMYSVNGIGSQPAEFNYTVEEVQYNFDGKVAVWVVDDEVIGDEWTVNIEDENLVLPTLVYNPAYLATHWLEMLAKYAAKAYIDGAKVDENDPDPSGVVKLERTEEDYHLFISELKKRGSVLLTIKDENDRKFADLNLTLNVTGPAGVSMPAELSFDFGNVQYAYNPDKVYPVSTGVNINLYSPEEGAAIRYSVNDGEWMDYTAPIAVDTEWANTTVSIKATAQSEGNEPSEVTEFTFDVKNWVRLENADQANNAKYFMMIYSTTKPLTLQTTDYNNQKMPMFNALNLTGCMASNNRIMNYSTNYMIVESVEGNNGTRYAKVFNTADKDHQYLCRSNNEKAVYLNATATNYAEMNFVYEGDLPYSLDGSGLTLYLNTHPVKAYYNYTTFKVSNYLLGEEGTYTVNYFGWGAERPEDSYKSTLLLNGEEVADLPEFLQPDDEVYFYLPYGYRTVINGVTSRVNYAKYNANAQFEEGATSGELVVDFEAVCPGFPSFTEHRVIPVYSLDFAFAKVSENGEETEISNAETVTFGNGSSLKVYGPDKAYAMSYKVGVYTGTSYVYGSETLVEGTEVAVNLPHKNGAYIQVVINALDADNNVLKTETVNGYLPSSANSHNIDFSSSAFAVYNTGDYLTGDQKSLSHHHNAGTEDSVMIFIPGGDNQVLHNGTHLVLNDNSMFRLALQMKGRRITALSINGENLGNLRIGEVYFDSQLDENMQEAGSIYPGGFKATGSIAGDNMRQDWTHDDNLEYDLAGIEIWNNPQGTPASMRKKAPARVAAADDNAARIRTIDITADQSTKVTFVFDDDSVRYFDLNGQPVNGDELAPGVYVRVANGKAQKVMIK